MQTTHFVSNGPLTTAYHEIGAGDPFMLVHGYTGSKLDFQDQLPWFADLRRVIAFDQRGHGESSNQPPYDFDVLVDDLLRFLDTLDIERCDLLGHSMGGMVAMRAVLAAPERIRSLILMDTSASPLPDLPARIREEIDTLVTDQGCGALVSRMRQLEPSPAQRHGIDFIGEQEHWRRISVKLQQMDPLAFTQLAPQLGDQGSILERIGNIECPTTVIVGEHDFAFVEPSALLTEHLPHASLVTVPDAAHSPQYENADAWRAAVREHLETHGSE